MPNFVEGSRSIIVVKILQYITATLMVFNTEFGGELHLTLTYVVYNSFTYFNFIEFLMTRS